MKVVSKKRKNSYVKIIEQRPYLIYVLSGLFTHLSIMLYFILIFPFYSSEELRSLLNFILGVAMLFIMYSVMDSVLKKFKGSKIKFEITTSVIWTYGTGVVFSIAAYVLLSLSYLRPLSAENFNLTIIESLKQPIEEVLLTILLLLKFNMIKKD